MSKEKLTGRMACRTKASSIAYWFCAGVNELLQSYLPRLCTIRCESRERREDGSPKTCVGHGTVNTIGPEFIAKFWRAGVLSTSNVHEARGRNGPCLQRP